MLGEITTKLYTRILRSKFSYFGLWFGLFLLLGLFNKQAFGYDWQLEQQRQQQQLYQQQQQFQQQQQQMQQQQYQQQQQNQLQEIQRQNEQIIRNQRQQRW